MIVQFALQVKTVVQAASVARWQGFPPWAAETPEKSKQETGTWIALDTHGNSKT